MTSVSAGPRASSATGNRFPRTVLGWIHVATGIVCAAILLLAVGSVFRPMLLDLHTLGSHDWDMTESHRYLVRKTILRFRQFPFWNPYNCGGHPVWGGFESDPIVISPWLPAYLFASFPVALRVEMIGSTLLGATGAWWLASRFTRSRPLCLLVGVLFALNSRWIMQIAVGHAWHPVYAYMPWALYFYDRAAGTEPLLNTPHRRDIALSAVFLALLVYTGGIYPLPHAAVVLAGYATLLSVTTRSLVPVKRMMACGLLGVGFAAPRLLPIMEVLRRFPRLTESTETMDFAGFFGMLTSRDQDVYSMPVRVSQWGWHEWGMYIGWTAVGAIFLGVIAARTVRERSLRIVGVVLCLLAFGAFSDYAPWPLLHRLPVFASQHVPSRWMLPALLVFACAAASAAERLLARTGRMRGLIEIGAMMYVAFMVRDLCEVVRPPLTHTFGRAMPAFADALTPFRTLEHVPAEIEYDPGEWSPSSLSALVANIGTIDCNTFPGFHNILRGRSGRLPGLGARGVGDGAYRGEVYVAEGRGTAEIAGWTPNAVEVRVEGANPGDHVVLNQNWDPGWSADGAAALSWHDTVAGVVPSKSATVRFRYRPRTLWVGLTAFALSIAALVWLPTARKRRAWIRARPLKM